MEIKNRKDITFFTPTLQRTGSEIVLYNLLNYLPDHFNATVVTLYRGDLYYSLPAKINKDHIYSFRKPSTWLIKLYYKLFRKKILINTIKKYKNSVWYVNTIVLPEIIDFAVENKIELIVHVHELQQMYSILSEKQLKQLITYPKLIIANSNASKAVLESYHARAEIKVCYPAIDTEKVFFKEGLYSTVRKKLNIAAATFVWVMVGSLDENKDPMLFVDIASELKKNYSDLKMMWVGSVGDAAGVEEKYKEYAKQKEVSDHIIWITDARNSYQNYFNCADGFVLTSKLESFSLVTLEALLLGLPVVANNCVGVNEILKSEYGKVVDNSDALKMSREMQHIMEQARSRDIETGREIAGKFDIRVWQKVWCALLNEYIYNKA